LWPPAAATSAARLTDSCPRTSEKSPTERSSTPSSSGGLELLFFVLRCHIRDPVAPLVGRQNPGDRLNPKLWKGLAQSVADVFGRRKVAAEYYGVRPLLEKRFQDVDQRFKFRVRFLLKKLRLFDDSQEGGIGFPGRTWFDVNRIFVIAVLVVELGFEAVGFIRYSIAEGAQTGGRRRTDAAHEGERPPESQTSFPLAASRPRDHPEAKVEHRLLEIEVRLRQAVGGLRRLVLGKGAILAPITCGQVDPPTLHELPRQTLAETGVLEIQGGELRIDQ
jgi:hypothetical protein